MISDIFEKTISEYKDVNCPIYVVMPNHFHAIITIEKDYCLKGFERADIESAPTISEVVQSFKRHSTIEYIKLVKQGLAQPFEKKGLAAFLLRPYYPKQKRFSDDMEIY